MTTAMLTMTESLSLGFSVSNQHIE